MQVYLATIVKRPISHIWVIIIVMQMQVLSIRNCEKTHFSYSGYYHCYKQK